MKRSGDLFQKRGIVSNMRRCLRSGKPVLQNGVLFIFIRGEMRRKIAQHRPELANAEQSFFEREFERFYRMSIGQNRLLRCGDGVPINIFHELAIHIGKPIFIPAFMHAPKFRRIRERRKRQMRTKECAKCGVIAYMFHLRENARELSFPIESKRVVLQGGMEQVVRPPNIEQGSDMLNRMRGHWAVCGFLNDSWTDGQSKLWHSCNLNSYHCF